MKRNRNPTNKSVMKRYTTLDSSIGSRSFFDRFSFILRLSFVHPSFELRSGIEEQSKNNRRWIEEVSEVHLRQYGGKTEMHRTSNGKP